MTINPLLLLQGQTTDPTESIAKGLALRENIQSAPLRNQLLQAQAERAPLENQLLQNQVQQQPTQNRLLGAQANTAEERSRQVIENGEMASIAQAALRLKGFLDNDNIEGAQRYLLDRQRQLNESGRNPQETNEAIASLQAGDIDGLKQNIDSILNASMQLGILGGANASFQRGAGAIVSTEDGNAFATPVFDPRTGSQRVEVSPIPGTLSSRTGETPQQTTDRRVEEKRRITEVVNKAENEADEAKKLKNNQASFSVWNTAMTNLVESLGGTMTGFGANWIPAMTANQQIADGAVSAMAPVLKQLFRASGEGQFTDKDQALLLGMVPTRADLPEARVAKIEAIDSIIRAKLGIFDENQQVNAQPRDGGQLMIDANGNRAMVYPDGTFEELK